MKIFTIGFTKKSAESFFTKLQRAGVKRLIDVRLNNVSQLAGFAKRDDLNYLAKVICGIKYFHLPELAPTYQSLVDRIAATSAGKVPSGSSVTSACYHAATIVNDSVAEKIVEWDSENDVFDIRDPYLLFYLRWLT